MNIEEKFYQWLNANRNAGRALSGTGFEIFVAGYDVASDEIKDLEARLEITTATLVKTARELQAASEGKLPCKKT